jgi:hypothetical protein
MVSLFRLLLAIALLAMSGCSKLGDYTADTTTVTPAPSPSVSVTVPEPDHEWNFENTPNDTGSATAWNGSFTGGANYTTTAGTFKVGTAAASFGAAGDGFPIGSRTVPSEMTVACWVKWTSSANPEYIIANSAAGPSANGFRLYVTAAGKINLETGNNTTGVTVTSNATLTTAYTHVVAVFDQVLNQSVIYVNGAQDQTGGVQSGYNLTATTFLGTEASNTDAFKGDLDDCRIYSISLSAAQVAILYNSY